ncbi:MAG: type II secretion system F family protein [Spirochaetes bacterium]|nr:type II secretion system F family protein [Spirochaetota bacterium]
MIFHYQALDRSGNSVSDIIDAPSETSARQKIRSQGLYLVKLNRQTADEQTGVEKRSSIFKPVIEQITSLINVRASVRYVGIFSRQLSTLLNAGVPLPTAITDIIDQIDNRYFRGIVADIKAKIEEGSSFSFALVKHRSVFSDMYINMVRVGENLGSLGQVMERLAELEEKKTMLKGKIKAALWYPAFMIFFAISVVTFLMVSVIPAIADVFQEQSQELPLPTEVVIAISGFMARFWMLIPVAVILAIYLFRRYVRNDAGRKRVDEIKLRIPVIKNLYRKLIVLRFTQNLGILLSNRVDLIKSFEIVEKIVGNRIIEERIAAASKRIKEGSSVSIALNKANFLPKLVLGMISAGEASDKLDAMLINIGKVYENELDLTITSLTSLLEPVIIIVMGVAVGVIVMSVMLPIMNMSTLLR